MRHRWDNDRLHMKLGFVGLVCGLLLFHLRWGNVRWLQIAVFVVSLVIVWLGLKLWAVAGRMLASIMAKEFWRRRPFRRSEPEPPPFEADETLPPLTAEQFAEASITPRTFQLFIDEAPDDTAAHRQCSHLESIGIGVTECERPAVIICGGCGRGTCLEAYHAYGLFGTIRSGLPHDRSGSKFYYYCAACHSFLCKVCLGLIDDYPCPPEQLERYVFECARCRAEFRASRLDHADMDDFVDVLADLPSSMLRLLPP